MAGRKLKDYDRYEHIVRDLVQQQLHGLPASVNASVERDVKITGTSGFAHQIDVVFRYTLLGVDFLCLVECKHYNKRVSVEDILTFKGRIDDIRASKGLFVTTVGYQDGALTVARQNRIALVLVRGRRWTGVLAAPDDTHTLARNFGRRLRRDIRARLDALPSALRTRIQDGRYMVRLRGVELAFDAAHTTLPPASADAEMTNGSPLTVQIDEGDTIPAPSLLSLLIAFDLAEVGQ